MRDDKHFWVEVAERANELLGMPSVSVEEIVWDCIPPALIAECVVKAHEEILEDNPKSADMVIK